MVSQVHKAHRVFKGQLAPRAHRVSPALRAQQVHKAPKVSKDQPARKVSKVKQSVVRHYSVSEAAEQLESLDYNFFLFYNTGSEKLNIIYRLEDGNYGLLDPDLTCVVQPGKK